uniref:Uncharacterized protein n=1 Tax=Rhizophagus irregularis (strain DAOM 181602 / DAOM 197198 / MUCL 43194) TaxID=747089 RepID=U9TZH1_RHIID
MQSHTFITYSHGKKLIVDIIDIKHPRGTSKSKKRKLKSMKHPDLQFNNEEEIVANRVKEAYNHHQQKLISKTNAD